MPDKPDDRHGLFDPDELLTFADAGGACIHDLLRRQLTGPHQLRGAGGAQVADVGHARRANRPTRAAGPRSP